MKQIIKIKRDLTNKIVKKNRIIRNRLNKQTYQTNFKVKMKANHKNFTRSMIMNLSHIKMDFYIKIKWNIFNNQKRTAITKLIYWIFEIY